MGSACLFAMQKPQSAHVISMAMMSRDHSKEALPENHRNQVLRVELTPFTMIKAVLVAGGTWLLIKLLPALLALVAALMLVGTLNPVVERLEARGIRRHAGIVIVFGILLIAIFLIITLTIPAVMDEVKSLIDQAPELRTRLLNILAGSPLTGFLANALRNLQYNLQFDELVEEPSVELPGEEEYASRTEGMPAGQARNDSRAKRID
jgi:hypothetical protein